MAELKIDYLYRQLHRIVEHERFSGRLVLAMGSVNNIRTVQNYLDCYSLKIQAVLDNDPKKHGTWKAGFKIFNPEDILRPFKKKALILVFSPGYGDQMKQQLMDMGYKENVHFFVLQDFRKREDNWRLFCKKLYEAKKGMNIYNRILRKYGKDIHIFIARGATGDVFFNGLYLDAYAAKMGIKRYVVAGDAKGLVPIASLFGIKDTISLSFDEAENLQQCYKFFRCKNVTDIFMWQGSLYFNYCQTRMHKEFNFLDTYTYYIYRGLVSRNEWKKPAFTPLSEKLEQKYRNMGLAKGNTVIVAPFAYSVKKIPIWVWEKLADLLHEKGYQVFANINTETEVNPFKNMRTVFFPFAECEAILQYSGYFLALRSGLCDIVSMIPCKQVLLYPEEMNPINYYVHRSDLIFSGFKAMGYDTEHIVELSSPVIQDAVCEDNDQYSKEELNELYYDLIEKIIANF